MRSFLTACIGFVFAAPSFSLTFSSEQVEVNFDDRTSVPAAANLNTLGKYGRLSWNGFQVTEPRQSSTSRYTGVEAKSSPNYIGATTTDFKNLPSISAEYTNSQVAFFDLQSLWWGCTTADRVTNVPKPGWCTLEAYGYARGVRQPVAKAQSFFFPQDDAKSMPMVLAELGTSFKGIYRVEFFVLATNPVLYLDNVKYTTYNVTSMGRGLSEVIHGHETSHGPYDPFDPEMNTVVGGEVPMGAPV